jgi:hypothetical protein
MAEIKGGNTWQKALDAIAVNVSKASVVEVGFLAGATYPDGTSVPMVAAINEYGAPSRGIPPRPFFRSMIAEKSKEWPDAVQKLLKAHGYAADATLMDMGELIKGELQQSIVDLISPPLAASTIAAKGSSKPLVDTGVMLRSVDYAVKSK